MTKFFDRILFGGDYNPNQWPKEIWEEDIRIFKKASINSATVNVFSWAKIQPSENCYDFEELDQIIEKLSTEGFDIVLATSTAALPAWMFKKYPEVARTDYDGRHHKFGQRHNACPNSLVYQKYAERLATKLAERYGEIVLPNALSEGIGYDKTAFAGISIDYRRFNSDSLLKNYMMERDAIRKIDPTTPITTNLMGTFKGLDYFKWAKEMDLVSWDNYPSYNTPWSLVAMTHDLMRGLKQQPFMLMEQTPSQQNWQPYNSLKKPGQMRAQSYQTIAHGADTIQYFQLRRSIGACEKFHGAVIEHVGHEDTRVFRETAALGAELAQLSDIIGTQTQAQVAVIFDWDNYWALEYTSGPTVDLKYVEQIHRYYRYFYEQNIAVDLVPVDADLSKYKLVAAPVLYMIKEGMQERLTDFVMQGGALLTTYMSGIVDQSDNVHLGGYPGPLRELAGIWVEEIDALAPEQSNGVSLVNEELTGTSNLVSDLIHLENAEALAHYTSNFYAGMPAVTKNTFGDGTVYYFGGQLEDQLQDQLFKTIVKETDITPVIEEATKLEIACRENEEAKFFVIINFHEEAQPLPEMFVGKTDLLTGKVLSSEMMLTQYTTYIVKEGRN